MNRQPRILLIGMLLGGGVMFCSSIASAATILLDLQASNYNASTGIWTDSSGNGNNAVAPAGDFPTVTASATPNHSSVVTFNGTTQYLNLTTSITSSTTGYTVFAYVETPGNGSSKAIVSAGTGSGSTNGFEYRIGGDSHGEVQELLAQSAANLGQSTTALTSGSFHLVDIAANNTGANFRLDGSANGSITYGSEAFAPGISQIGNANAGEIFSGSIAEIRIYAGQLNSTDIATAESSMTAAYVPEPATFGLLGIACAGALIRRRRGA
jgi:hypothetical protein